MLIGELAKRIGRTPETVKRWADDGLVRCGRDERNRRIFDESHVVRCRELARLSAPAQVQNRKLADLAKELPEQLGLLSESLHFITTSSPRG